MLILQTYETLGNPRVRLYDTALIGKQELRMPALSSKRLLSIFILVLASHQGLAGGSLTPADIHSLAAISGPAFSPDGRTIAYSIEYHDVETDALQSELFVVDYRSGSETRLTDSKESSEWAPSFSADGKQLFYLSDQGDEGVTQVWSMPAGGGKAKAVTAWSEGVQNFTLSPDGKRLAFIATEATEHPPQASSQADKEDATPPPIVTSRFYFKEDGSDYLTDQFNGLYVLDLASGEHFRLGDPGRNAWLPSWSPDSQRLAYVAKTGEKPDQHLNYDIYLVDATAGAVPRQFSRFIGTDGEPDFGVRPQWSPDGSKLMWLQGRETKWIYYAPQQLVIADVASGTTRPLVWQDRWMYSPVWADDGLSVYAIIEESRESQVIQIDLASSSVSYLTAGPRFAQHLILGADGRLVELAGDDLQPYALYALEGAKRRQLTQHNAWLAQRTLQSAENFEFNSDGVAIHGFYTRPPGDKPAAGYPTVVQLHGGPVYQYSREFDFDRQLFAANGYLVVSINPRGSSGRGFDFARAIYTEWGGKDVRDILAGIDHLQAQGLIDPAKIALTGWSYGGMLTHYLIASDTRFAAAISGAGATNVYSTFGHDMYIREYLNELGTPWDNREAYDRVSYPFLHANRIKTPTLFQCTGKDFNVPCIGAEQMYQALRVLDIPTQLVIYPDQNHWPEVPSYLQDRLERNLAWLQRFMR